MLFHRVVPLTAFPSCCSYPLELCRAGPLTRGLIVAGLGRGLSAPGGAWICASPLRLVGERRMRGNRARHPPACNPPM